MDFNINPDVVQTAKIGAYGLGGAFVHHAIYPAKTKAKIVVNGLASCLCALIMTPPFMKWSGADPDSVGVFGWLFGLCGLGIATGLLTAVKRFDMAKLLPENFRKDGE